MQWKLNDLILNLYHDYTWPTYFVSPPKLNPLQQPFWLVIKFFNFKKNVFPSVSLCHFHCSLKIKQRSVTTQEASLSFTKSDRVQCIIQLLNITHHRGRQSIRTYSQRGPCRSLDKLLRQSCFCMNVCERTRAYFQKSRFVFYSVGEDAMSLRDK